MQPLKVKGSFMFDRYVKLFLTTMFFLLSGITLATNNSQETQEAPATETTTWIANAKQNVHKHVLPNGLTVLFYNLPTTNEVYVGITYDVGSKDEHPQEYGLAHMVEHMIFKGTTNLSETDIKEIAEKFYLGSIGDSYGAYTSLDQTTYYFTTDKKNWTVFLNIIADCMYNARFDENHFSSEVKTVVNEIKMYHGDGPRKLFESSYAEIFQPTHPYHHPIGGYKEILLQKQSQNLKDFYSKYYKPSRAILTVVGNLDEQTTLVAIKKCLNQAPDKENKIQKLPQTVSSNPTSPMCDEFVQKNINFYMHVPKPIVIFVWQLPGLIDQTDEPARAIAHILNERLRKLADTQDLVFVSSASLDTNLCGSTLNVYLEPKDGTPLEKCRLFVEEEITQLIKQGPTEDELINFKNSNKAMTLRCFESCVLIANMVTSSYFTHHNEFEVFDALERCEKITKGNLKNYAQKYLRPLCMHTVSCFPVPEKEKSRWTSMQAEVDQYDQTLLMQKARATQLEQPSKGLNFPDPQVLDIDLQTPDKVFTLSNGLLVYAKKRTATPFISVRIGEKDTEENFITQAQAKQLDTSSLAYNLLLEGDENFTKQDHIKFFQKYGALCSGMGFSCLSQDFEIVGKRYAYILTKPGYPQDIVEQEIGNAIELIKKSEEDPHVVAGKQLQLYLFKDYPWIITNKEEIERLKGITRDDIVMFHQTHITPHAHFLVVVGNYDEKKLQNQLEEIFKGWHSSTQSVSVKDAQVPDISNPPTKQLTHFLPDEQVIVLAQRVATYADDPDDMALRLLDTHFNRKLFDIRDSLGICYAIGANLALSGHFKSRGAATVYALVSLDKVDQITEEIKKTLRDVQTHGITKEYLKTAQETYLMHVAKSYSTNEEYSSTYSYLVSHNKPWDYLQNKTHKLAALTVNDVNLVAKKYLNPETWTFITVGRVNARS